MLTAYFDDSGTHDNSDVVLWAGLFGNEHQWAHLDDLWAAKLLDPSPGKAPIQTFHMYDCDQSIGEFAGWSRTASDLLALELGQIIIKCGIYGYAIAIWRNDYDELIQGDGRAFFGDAEGMCVRSCYVRSLAWAREYAAYDPNMSFVFDDRPHRRPDQQAVHAAFSHDESGKKPDLAAIAFASAAKFRPLQAADLFAWEYYQHAKEIVWGRSEPGKPKRLHFQKLIASGRVECQIATRVELEIMASSINTSDRAERNAFLANAWQNAISEAASAEAAEKIARRKLTRRRSS
jgi:hypothetical protein